jgi:hypothetical protein
MQNQKGRRVRRPFSFLTLEAHQIAALSPAPERSPVEGKGKGNDAAAAEASEPPAPTLAPAMRPAEALQLLRGHKRTLAAAAPGSGVARKQGRRPRVATCEEVRVAVAKALAAFGKRCRATGCRIQDEAPRDDKGTTPPAARRGPEPGPSPSAP